MKSLVGDAEPAAIALRGRACIMHRIESRFRFLAVRPPSILAVSTIRPLLGCAGAWARSSLPLNYDLRAACHKAQASASMQNGT